MGSLDRLSLQEERSKIVRKSYFEVQ